MIDLSVFILCCGEQKRFPPGMLKQTLNIDGQPLIERTVKQVRDLYQVEPWVCARADHPFGLSMRYFYPSEYRYIFDTLMSTSGQWAQTNIILLGDVYYSANALIIIKNYPEFAFGTRGEIFAVKFSQADIHKLSQSVGIARINAQNGGNGKLWNVYRAWEGLPQDSLFLGSSFNHLPENDETQDFDRPVCYTDFIARRQGMTA